MRRAKTRTLGDKVKTALTRGSFLALTLLVLMVAFEVLMIAFRDSAENSWQRISVELGMTVGIAAISLAGATIGFKFLPPNRSLSPLRLLGLAALFAIPAFFGFVVAFNFAGITGALAGLALFAMTVAFVGGRIVSRNVA